jgi:phage protein D
VVADYRMLQTPVVVLRIDGGPAPDLAARIVELKYSDKSRGAKKKKHMVESLDVVLSDPLYELEGDPRLDTEATWDVRFGYVNDLTERYTFKLKYYTPEFTAEGAHVKKLFLLGTAHALTENRRGKNWGRVPTSSIATAIAKQGGFKAVVDPSDDQTSTAYVQPLGTSDFDYLNELAADIDFEFYVRNDVLYYKSRDSLYAENPRSFHVYGGVGTLLKAFVPTVKATADVNVSAKGVSKDGKTVSSTATPQNVGGTHLGQDVLDKITSGRPAKRPYTKPTSRADAEAIIAQAKRDYNVVGLQQRIKQTQIDAETGALSVTEKTIPVQAVVATPETDPKKVGKVVKAMKRHFMDKTVEASAEFIGSPVLQTKTTHVFVLPERRLSGLWYIKEVTHTLSPSVSYTVSAKLHRGAFNKGKKGGGKTTGNRTTADQQKPVQGTKPQANFKISAETGRVVGTPQTAERWR